MALRQARTIREDEEATGSARKLLFAAACAATALAVGVSPLLTNPVFAQNTTPRSEKSAIEGPSLGEGMQRMIAIDQGDEGPATLEADRIVYDPDTEIVRATGNVEVFYGGRALRADELVYDAQNDRITAKGEITVVNPDGSVIVADNAEFDSKIRDGFIRGARAVLADGQARVAALEARRVDGQYTTLSKAVYSPCETCKDNPNPLWQIRARKVIQDEEARDIIYEDATFEVMGVPVAYLPFFRHADPSVKRRSGFLTPSFQSSSSLGYAIKTPYYYAFSPNRDLTLTPFLATDELPVLEGEYRAWEEYGKYELAGSVTHSTDDLESGTRGHFKGEGVFDLPYDYKAGFDSTIASDDTYLRRYGLDYSDRVQTNLYIERYRTDSFTSLEAIRYQSFREDEAAGGIPLVLPRLEVGQYWDAPVIGGEIALTGDALALQRTEGRDMRRLSSTLGWRRNFVSETGVVLDARSEVRGDLYQVEDDVARSEGFQGRVLPLAAITASLPLGKTTDTAQHIIEPVAQLVYAPYGGNPNEIPNEDSQDAELDELSIFSLNRFPGKDRWEEGPRATIGLRYQRIAATGPQITATIGQTYRTRETDAFSNRSGLDGVVSDVVGAWTLSDASDQYEVGHRFRVSDGFNFNRNEVYASAKLFDRLELSGGYVFLDADPAAGSTEDRSEASAAATLRLTDNWSVLGGVRRDIERRRFVTANSGIRYEDECVAVDFTLDRRFNSVDDAPSSTNFGVAVRLKTLGDR